MRASGPPVYLDMGGTLAPRPDGAIVYYDPETDECRAEDDAVWQRLALRRASQDYPELRALLPARPDDAITSIHCDGRGQVGEFDCWPCAGSAGRPDERANAATAGLSGGQARAAEEAPRREYDERRECASPGAPIDIRVAASHELALVTASSRYAREAVRYGPHFTYLGRLSSRTWSHDTPPPAVLTHNRERRVASHCSTARPTSAHRACLCVSGARRRKAARWG